MLLILPYPFLFEAKAHLMSLFDNAKKQKTNKITYVIFLTPFFSF